MVAGMEACKHSDNSMLRRCAAHAQQHPTMPVAAILSHIHTHFQECTWDQAAQFATTLSGLDLNQEHVSTLPCLQTYLPTHSPATFSARCK